MTTIVENLARCSDQELIALLPYIRDENGERVSLDELKHYLAGLSTDRDRHPGS